MDDTTRIVVEHFPAERLPEEFRERFKSGETVTLTMAAEPVARAPRRLQDFVGAGPGAFGSPAEVLESLRDGRDAV